MTLPINAVITVREQPWAVSVTEPAPAVVVTGAIQVIPGPGQDVYAHRILLSAGAALSGHRAVISLDGVATYADPADPAHAGRLAGITTHAAVAGAGVIVQTLGLLVDPSWTWQPGTVYLGANGALTQALPAAGSIWPIGTALNKTTLLVAPGPRIQLTE